MRGELVRQLKKKEWLSILRQAVDIAANVEFVDNERRVIHKLHNRLDNAKAALPTISTTSATVIIYKKIKTNIDIKLRGWYKQIVARIM